MRRAKDAMRAVRAAAEKDDLKRLDDLADRCLEFLKTDGFPFQRKQEITDEIKVVRRDCYQRSVARLLEAALAAAQSEDMERRNALMGEAKTNMSMALRLGVGPEFKTSVQRKVDVILMTSAPGTDEKAREAGESEPEPTRHISGAPGAWNAAGRSGTTTRCWKISTNRRKSSAIPSGARNSPRSCSCGTSAAPGSSTSSSPRTGCSPAATSTGRWVDPSAR